jgi:hypothetical protein
MAGENVYFDAKINKMDTCLVEKFKFTFDKSEDLQEKHISFTRKKMEERKMKLKNPILYPVTDFSPYFKICIRKTHKNTLLKYEVDWIYLLF